MEPASSSSSERKLRPQARLESLPPSWQSVLVCIFLQVVADKVDVCVCDVCLFLLNLHRKEASDVVLDCLSILVCVVQQYSMSHES